MPHPTTVNRRAFRVTSFNATHPVWRDEVVRAAPNQAVIEVDAASVGSTDVLARQGRYLLHPRPGFVSGYDLAGTVISSPDARFSPGERVVAIMPRMGGHATHVAVDPTYLVRVPAQLGAECAATIPLDGVTAKHALDMAGVSAKSIFISGVSGAVGRLIAQLALNRGLRVAGTASAQYADDLGAVGISVFDYHTPDWRQKLVAECGLLDAIIDHTGDSTLRALVKPTGRIIRIAFSGTNGPTKTATFRGFARDDVLIRCEAWRACVLDTVIRAVRNRRLPPRPRKCDEHGGERCSPSDPASHVPGGARPRGFHAHAVAIKTGYCVPRANSILLTQGSLGDPIAFPQP